MSRRPIPLRHAAVISMFLSLAPYWNLAAHAAAAGAPDNANPGLEHLI